MAIKAMISKTVGEEFPIGFEITSPDLEDGHTITAVTVTEHKGDGAITIDGAATWSGNTVQQNIKAGTDGVDYTLRFEIVTSAGRTFEPDYLVKVRD